MSHLFERLQYESGLSFDDLTRLIQTAPRRYKTYNIPKRTGGMREIAQPAREIKLLQRIIVRDYLECLPVHPSATAYRKGISIRDNALHHAGDTPILKLDFVSFFPSITADDWIRYCSKHGIFNDDRDISITSNLLFRKAKGERTLRLSIGAPSSPLLSNLILFDFDQTVAAEAELRGIVYTRYADDLTFSGQRIGMLKDMVAVVSKTVRQLGPRLRLNNKKTTFVTPAARRFVTGVVLGNDGSIGMARSERKLLRAKVDHAKKGLLSLEQMRQLCGHLAHLRSIDPSYFASLRRTFGDDLIKKIQSAVVK